MPQTPIKTHLLQQSMIEVKKIPSKGRGIISTQDIPEDALIEVAPVGVFKLEERMRINETDILKYYFVKPSEYGKSKNMKGYLVFGLASLCNHKEIANAYIKWVEDETGLWSHLIAKKHIKQGEEVTLFYTNIDEYNDGNQFI